MSLLCTFYVSLYFSPLPHLVSPRELFALPPHSCEEFHGCTDLILLAVKLVPRTFIWSTLPCVLEVAMKHPSLTILSNPPMIFRSLSYSSTKSSLPDLVLSIISWHFPLNFLHTLVEMEIPDCAQHSAYTQKGAQEPTTSSRAAIQGLGRWQ